ncbi:helix-turn-helix domain-containing protein [Chryseobacterium sp.]|uniref:helix-turn-helix domain-containing protein n=1 Tax=Chryseobacterium sp. TaxID=1871047 RepID=UPI0024E23409|nr:helix-turn-helix domain-containing protein [Chryseobacterium sp.]
MKNPKTNPEIDAIVAVKMKELGYVPGDNIPNSIVSRALNLINGNAALEYAKSQNRPVRRAKMGECEYTLKNVSKESKPRHDPNKPKGMYSTKEAADKIGINVASLQERKRKTHITAVKVGKRLYYSEDEVYRLKAKLMKTA